MNFLHIEALPHSLATMNLLVFLLFIVKTLFVAYLATLIGGTFLSIYFRKLFLKTKKNEYLDYSLSFISKLNSNYLTPFGLGIAPLFAIIFIFIQFSDNPNNSVISNLIILTILFPISLILSKLDYKKFSNFLANKNYANFSNNAMLANFSLVLFLIVAFIYTTSEILFLNLGGNIGSLGMSTVLFNFNGLISFFSILALSFAFAIINFLQFEFKTENEDSAVNSHKLVEEKSSSVFKLSSISIAVFLVLRDLLVNQTSTSIVFWLLSIGGIFFLLLSIYLINKSKSELSKKSYIFPYLAFLVFVLGFGGADSMLFLKSSDSNMVSISKKYDEEIVELKAANPVQTTTVNAEDIFFDKCITCHQFDKKAVGPALKDVVVKYKNDKNKLKEFLLNPTKVDPNFPQMPNQGLKPAEAKAIAEYLFKELGIK
jgi:cytochrome c